MEEGGERGRKGEGENVELCVHNASYCTACYAV